MTTRDKVNQLPTAAQKAIRDEAATLAEVGQELIFVETGVGYWEDGFYNACFRYAFERYEAKNDQ